MHHRWYAVPAARGFGFNNFTSIGAISSYNMFSTTPTATVADGVQGTPYTVAQLTGAVGTAFNIAIDVNTTNAAGRLCSCSRYSRIA